MEQEAAGLEYFDDFTDEDDDDDDSLEESMSPERRRLSLNRQRRSRSGQLRRSISVSFTPCRTFDNNLMHSFP